MMSYARFTIALVIYGALVGIVIVTKPRAMFDAKGDPYGFGTGDGDRTMGFLPYVFMAALVSSYVAFSL
jgi:hypothetical protein